MTPLEFEARHGALWDELENALTAVRSRWKRGAPRPSIDRARVVVLYRAACEHLAVAEARSYPVWLIARLQSLTARAHQRIYRQSDLGLGKLARLPPLTAHPTCGCRSPSW